MILCRLQLQRRDEILGRFRVQNYVSIEAKNSRIVLKSRLVFAAEDVNSTFQSINELKLCRQN